MKNQKSRVRLFAILFAIVSMSAFSCTDAYKAKLGGLGDEFKIELVNCDGTVTRQWISTGKVSTEQNSDGYYFMDKKTGKLIEVSGTLIITKQTP